MPDQLARITRAIMLSEGEVFDIAVAVQPERKHRSVLWFAVPLFLLGFALLILALSLQGGA